MKHLIKIDSTPHGILGVRHTGLDNQYCEAGELVILEWQPDAKWGLQEAHYTDGNGNVTVIDLTRTKVDGVNVVAFVMPDKDITIGGTFKRFAIEDWTGRDAAFSIVGSFDVANLPTLDGFNDAGKVAFVKDTRKYATWDGYGWTYMNGTPVTPRYLTFTANEDGSSVGFCCWSEDYEPVDMGKNMQYSTDGGKTWEDYTIGVGEDNLAAINIDEGESVMFKGVNDSLVYAKEIVRLLKGIECRMNLIRFHAIPNVDLDGTGMDHIIAFRDYLTQHGVFATIRASRGEDIFAACGMLSTAKQQEEKKKK